MLLIVVSVCNALLGIVLTVGAGYAVFVLDRSPWWFAWALLAYILLVQEVKFITPEKSPTGSETNAR